MPPSRGARDRAMVEVMTLMAAPPVAMTTGHVTTTTARGTRVGNAINAVMAPTTTALEAMAETVHAAGTVTAGMMLALIVLMIGATSVMVAERNRTGAARELTEITVRSIRGTSIA